MNDALDPLPLDPDALDQLDPRSASAGDSDPPPETEAPSVLERLGPSPFPRSGFPLLGFLATVYDHVAESARKRLEG